MAGVLRKTDNRRELRPGPLVAQVGAIRKDRNDVREHPWIEEFQKKVAPRLREMFEKDVGNMPKGITDKIEELRKREQQLRKRNKK